MQRLNLIVLLLVALSGGDAIAQPRQIPLPEPPFDRSGINTGIFRHHGLLSIGDKQAVTYFAADGRVIVAVRAIGASSIERHVALESHLNTRDLGDGHQAISMGYTADGYLHLIWGAHDTPHTQYCKLHWPELSIASAGTAREMLGIPRLSYPQFVGDPEHSWLSFRRDGSPDPNNRNDHCLFAYDLSDGKWRSLHEPFLTFPPSPQLAYLNAMGTQGSHRAIVFTIRRYDLMDVTDPHMRVMNESIRYLRTSDYGATWHDTSGNAHRPPIAALDVPLSVRIAPNQNLINQGGGWMDDRLRYHAGYFRNDAQGIPQIFLTSFDVDGKVLGTAQLSRRTAPFDLLGRGTQRWPLSRPLVFGTARIIVVVYREANELVCAYRNHDSATWHRATVFRGKLENYEPIIDESGASKGQFTFYVQPSDQGADDTPATALSSSNIAFLLEFSESELVRLPSAAVPQDEK